jgi:hypothetical protein
LLISQTKQQAASLFDSDTLGQVSGEINIQSFSNGKPVGHQLQWNHVDETLQAINVLRNLDLVNLIAQEFRICSVANDDWSAFTSMNLLISIQRLCKDVVSGKNHDERQVLIDEGKDTVLQLARHDGFTMKIGDFLDLEST